MTGGEAIHATTLFDSGALVAQYLEGNSLAQSQFVEKIGRKPVSLGKRDSVCLGSKESDSLEFDV